MKRIYDSLLEEHLANQTEMLFLTGPRQVGKTTTSKQAQHYCSQFTYLNWDNEDHRNLLLSGPSAIFQQVQTQHNQLTEEGLGKAVVVFDEIHKRPDWKNFLKGFFDTYGKEVQIIVTGSARLDLYKKGGIA